MQNITIMNSKQIKVIRKFLQEQFGFEERLDFVFLINTKGKIYAVNREIEKLELEKLRIDSIGLYFGTLAEDGFRPSIEGSQIIGPRCTKNTLEIDDSMLDLWLKGKDFEIAHDKDSFVLVKHNDDFVGCGRVKGGVLLNYVPKPRRLVVVNN